jgi:ketosteroid isomerase-like protein
VSQENVEVVRRALVAATCRDDAAAADCFHSDAEWHNTREFPGPSVCVGPAAIIGFWQTLLEEFDESAAGQQIERITETDTAVVVDVHSVGRGRTGGVPVDVKWAAVFTVRDGRISRVDVHGEWSKALKAVGLTE